MSNQVQRPGAHVPYDPESLFYPNGTRKMHTCDYWARGQCRYTAAVCNNAHSWLEFVPGSNLPAGFYQRPVPFHRDHLHNLGIPTRAAYLNARDSYARSSTPAPGPVYAANDSILPLRQAAGHRGQLDHIAGMSLLETALRNSNQDRAPQTTANLAVATLHQQVHPAVLPAVDEARMKSNQPTSRLPLPPMTPFNPAAPIFRSSLQPNREAEYRNKSESLIRTLDEQTDAIVAVQEGLFNTTSEIFCIIKNLRDVVKSLQQGQGSELTHLKKLQGHATDLEAVLGEQEKLRRLLADLAMPDVSRA